MPNHKPGFCKEWRKGVDPLVDAWEANGLGRWEWYKRGHTPFPYSILRHGSVTEELSTDVWVYDKLRGLVAWVQAGKQVGSFFERERKKQESMLWGYWPDPDRWDAAIAAAKTSDPANGTGWVSIAQCPACNERLATPNPEGPPYQCTRVLAQELFGYPVRWENAVVQDLTETAWQAARDSREEDGWEFVSLLRKGDVIKEARFRRLPPD